MPKARTKLIALLIFFPLLVCAWWAMLTRQCFTSDLSGYAIIVATCLFGILAADIATGKWRYAVSESRRRDADRFLGKLDPEVRRRVRVASLLGFTLLLVVVAGAVLLAIPTSRLLAGMLKPSGCVYVGSSDGFPLAFLALSACVGGWLGAGLARAICGPHIDALREYHRLLNWGLDNARMGRAVAVSLVLALLLSGSFVRFWGCGMETRTCWVSVRRHRWSSVRRITEVRSFESRRGHYGTTEYRHYVVRFRDGSKWSSGDALAYSTDRDKLAEDAAVDFASRRSGKPVEFVRDNSGL